MRLVHIEENKDARRTGQLRSIDSGGFDFYPEFQQWGHLPADRHHQGCNLSFADGHVEHYRWRTPKIFRSSPQAVANDSELLDFKRLTAGVEFQR